MSEIRRPENGKNGLSDRMGTKLYSSEDNKKEKNLSGIDILSRLKYFQPEDKNDKTTMKEFDTTYNPNKATHWYTRETCIYKILNKALRIQNIGDITTFGPFIKDLTIRLT